MALRKTSRRLALAAMAMGSLAACGGSATPRTYQPLALPPDLALYELTEAQQRTFCAWM